MHPKIPTTLRTTAATTAHPAPAPMHTLWLCGAWLVLAASASLNGQTAQAADMSAAAASALKVLSMPLPANANVTAAPNSPAIYGEAAAFPASITVKSGESIDAVIRRGLPGLPLRDEFMRQALAKANPRIFPKGTTYPVRPGTVLQMPSLEALRQLMLDKHPQAAALFQVGSAPSSEAATGQDKRRWVRFP